MKFKIWAEENLTETELFDGNTNYETIESHVNSDIVNPADLSRPLKNIYSNQDNIYKYLYSLARVSTNEGVIKNTLTKNFEGVFQSVTLDTTVKDYVYLKTGIAYNNSFTVVNQPQLFTAARQIEKILLLDTSEDEKVVINYDLSADEYSATVTTLNATGTLEDTNFLAETNAVNLLAAIYNSAAFTSYFVTAIGTDLTKIELEETLVELSITDVYYWIIDANGDIINSINSPLSSEITLQNVTYTETPTHTGVYDAVTNIQYAIKNQGDHNGNIFLNVGDHPDFDSNTITNVFDYTPDYTSEIVDANAFLVFMRGGNGSGLESGVFGWSEGDVDDIDDYSANINTSEVFYMNKDLVVRYGTAAGDLALFSDIVATASAGLPVVATPSNLPGSASDGTINFVRSTNMFYRYNTSIAEWIIVSDPHKQFSGQTEILRADEGTVGNTTYTFSLSFKEDGTNIDVYVNGVHQDNGSGSEYDYTITDEHTIVFDEGLTNDETNTYVSLRVIQGGENFYPEQKFYVAGTAETPYSGDLFEFKVDFHIMPERTDVFKNGSILRDSELETSVGTLGLGSVVSASSTTVFVGASVADVFTGMAGSFIIFSDMENTDDNYKVREIQSVSTTTYTDDTITLDTALALQPTPGDNFKIYEAFDFFVNSYTDTVHLALTSNTLDSINIRDRAGVASTYGMITAGANFPSYPIFGEEFYLNTTGVWWKYDGTSWQEIFGPIDSTGLDLGVDINSSPTGGTATTLTAADYVDDAFVEVFARLINLSGVSDDSVDSRHIAADSIDDEHINWGTGGGDAIGAANIPILDSGTNYTATDVEAALAEAYDDLETNVTATGLNTTHSSSDGTDHGYINQDVQSTATPEFAGLTFGTGTIDRNIEFATDADIFWDESEDEFYLNKSLKVDNGIETDGTKLKTKVIDIVNWDMDVNATKDVAHGVTYANIRSVDALIRDDAGTLTTKLVGSSSSTYDQGEIRMDSTNIILERVGSGFFDSTDYDALGDYVRGWITIVYVV